MEEFLGVLFFKQENGITDKVNFWKPQTVVEGEKFTQDDKVGIKTKDNIYLSFDDDINQNIICDLLVSKKMLDEIFPDVKDMEEKKEKFLSMAKEYFLVTSVIEGKIYSKRIDVEEFTKQIACNEYCMIPSKCLNEWKEKIENGDIEELKTIFSPIYQTIQNMWDNLEEKRSSYVPEVEYLDVEKNYNTSLEKLNKLIGLENIKKEVTTWIGYLEFYQKVFEHTSLEDPNLNMIFYGNPGTGKTTVARLLTDILYGLNLIESPILVEVTASDFISNHVGETAIKTKKLLDDFRGSLIFIDEAYAFALEYNRFADEALVEILKEMEKHESVFILAGYKQEMQDLLKMNPGLESRIGSFYKFEDFTLEELINIWNYKLNKHGFKQEKEVIETVKNMIIEAKNTPNYGNARYINKLFDKAIIRHALNCKNIDDIEKLITLRKEDFEDISEQIKYKEKVKKIGF